MLGFSFKIIDETRIPQETTSKRSTRMRLPLRSYLEIQLLHTKKKQFYNSRQFKKEDMIKHREEN